ncbi:hypothetical protein E0F15_21215 [Frankia sp. B2]|uniref:helix-turn-helix domain-containing protein n=1 Tax=Frankia sp. B2 TaxID=2541730 RepID=UPI00106BD274|nr:hypothetical protein [Frankia sp. B2]TFE24612.1 hypothetical protein E0F15_21215 [Frankia sp. B2]
MPASVPNDALRQARQRLLSPSVPGAQMSRRELADLVNEAVFHGESSPLDAQYIGRLERGTIRWPQASYRAALRAILHADTDAELGFFPHGATVPRPGTRLIPHGTPPTHSPGPPAMAARKPHHRYLGVPTLTEGGVPADAGLDRLWSSTGLAAALGEVALLTSPLGRRQFLALSGGALVTAGYEWLVADPVRLAGSLAGKTADSALVADLSGRSARFRRASA